MGVEIFRSLLVKETNMNENQITAETILLALKRISAADISISKYAEIQKFINEKNDPNELDEKNQLTDKAKKFQTLFNGYYKVRRNEAWRKKYYEVFSDYAVGKKKDKVSFGNILDDLKQLKTKKGSESCEASFASKMLATLDPAKPVLDNNVLTALGLDRRFSKEVSNERDPKEKFKNAKALYAELEAAYTELLKGDSAKAYIKIYDEKVTSETKNMADAKKIDLLLWSLGQ